MKILKNKKELVIFSILIVIFFIVQLNRLQIGFPSSDEQLYIVFPYRLFQGDLLFIHEWHSAQLIGFITLPLLKLYLFINNNSLEGIVYFFRLCYLILMTITIITIFVMSKKNIIIVLSLLIYFLSCPFNIMSLSYNTLSVMFILITLFLLYKYSNKLAYIISGIFFSLSVLCIPYLAIIYLISTILIIILAVKKNTKYLYGFVMFSLGILLMTIIFFMTMYRGNISGILKGVSIILNDPSHQGNILGSIIDYFYQFIRFSNIFLLIWIFLTIKAWKCKNNNKDKYVRLAIANCYLYIIFCFILYNISTYRYLFMNYTLMISLLGITGYMASEQKDKKLLVIYITSFLFSFILNMQSNVGTQPITTGLLVTNVFSIIILEPYVNNKKIMNYIVGLCIMIICYLLYFKTYIYDYPKDYKGNILVDNGLYKGLKVNESEYEFIRNWEEEANKINELIVNKDDRILLLDGSPLKYLSVDARIGTFSTYVYLNDTEERSNLYKEYIDLNKHSIKYIYIPYDNAINVPSLNNLILKKCENIKFKGLGTLYYCDME